MPPKVFIIVLNWNGNQDTLECLASLQSVTYRNLEVMVVDNGSTDSSVNAVRQAYPDVTLLLNHANLGFAEGNNVGIRHALDHGADYVLLLNNDTVVDPGFIEPLVETAQNNPRAGVVGSKIYFYSNPERIWFGGARWIERGAQFGHIGYGEIDDNVSYEEVRDTAYVCGCVFMASAAALRTVGLLEPKFFLTYEETDWCYRAKKAGYTCLFVPKSKIWHKVSRSFGGEGSPLRNYFMTRNRLLWIERNLPLRQKPNAYQWFLRTLQYQLRSAKSPSFRERMALRRAILSGVRDYILRRFGDCPSSMRSA